jgi:transcription termination/antitermination protein NusG
MDVNNEAKWYVLHTFTGYENVAKQNLEIVRDNFNLQNRIFDIVIPMEDVVEEKKGIKKIVSKKILPSYILIKMIYGDDIWHAITRTRGVTGFVGPKGRPLALNEDEIQKMHLEKIECTDPLAPNDKIEVVDGPLTSMVGTIIEVDEENKRVKANVEMFGRETVVDLTYAQIKKI